ncbi:MAG: helix-turn-helix domain-containing protein [Candidatus Moraniibacteriota bacterium]
MNAVNFTRKKVGSMTLGEKFRKIRNDRRIALGEVSRSTKIQVKYLEAIENGEYDKLPAEVYVRGFLRSYAGYLGVPEDVILRLYERERNIQKNLGRVDTFRFEPAAPIRFFLSVSPKSIAVAAGFLVAIGFFVYLSLELRSFVSEPRLSITGPVEGETVTGSETVVSGETDPRAKVLINGEETVVNEDGGFSERLTLKSGLNEITVSSTNRFGKERERMISVNADIPETPTADQSAPQAEIPVQKAVRVTVRAVAKTNLSVRADGQIVWNGEATKGLSLDFEAEKDVTVSADSGSAILARSVNGSEAPLSDGNGPAKASFGVGGRS